MANKLPPSGVYPSQALDDFLLTLQEPVKALLAAKGKARVLQLAYNITNEKMPDRIAESYSIPCSEPRRLTPGPRLVS